MLRVVEPKTNTGWRREGATYIPGWSEAYRTKRERLDNGLRRLCSEQRTGALNRKQIADACGCSPQNIERIELGALRKLRLSLTGTGSWVHVREMLGLRNVVRYAARTPSRDFETAGKILSAIPDAA